MGSELRDLFIARITRDLAELGVHIYCGRSAIRAEALRGYLSESLAFFLQNYIPLIIAANHLCSVEEDWTSDLKLLWQDLESLIAERIRILESRSLEANVPPRAIDRIKKLDRNDPIGAIMLAEFENLFPEVLKQQSSRFIVPD